MDKPDYHHLGDPHALASAVDIRLDEGGPFRFFCIGQQFTGTFQPIENINGVPDTRGNFGRLYLYLGADPERGHCPRQPYPGGSGWIVLFHDDLNGLRSGLAFGAAQYFGDSFVLMVKSHCPIHVAAAGGINLAVVCSETPR